MTPRLQHAGTPRPARLWCARNNSCAMSLPCVGDAGAFNTLYRVRRTSIDILLAIHDQPR